MTLKLVKIALSTVIVGAALAAGSAQAHHRGGGLTSKMWGVGTNQTARGPAQTFVYPTNNGQPMYDFRGATKF